MNHSRSCGAVRYILTIPPHTLAAFDACVVCFCLHLAVIISIITTARSNLTPTRGHGRI